MASCQPKCTAVVRFQVQQLVTDLRQESVCGSCDQLTGRRATSGSQRRRPRVVVSASRNPGKLKAAQLPSKVSSPKAAGSRSSSSAGAEPRQGGATGLAVDAAPVRGEDATEGEGTAAAAAAATEGAAAMGAETTSKEGDGDRGEEHKHFKLSAASTAAFERSLLGAVERSLGEASVRVAERLAVRVPAVTRKVVFGQAEEAAGAFLASTLPFLGGALVIYLATDDWRRAKQERAAASARAERAFLLACACDAMDGTGHLIVGFGILERQYGVGLPLTDEALHLLEVGGLIIATFSTIFAVTGEILSVLHEIEREKREDRERAAVGGS